MGISPAAISEVYPAGVIPRRFLTYLVVDGRLAASRTLVYSTEPNHFSITAITCEYGKSAPPLGRPLSTSYARKFRSNGPDVQQRISPDGRLAFARPSAAECERSPEQEARELRYA